MLAHQLDFSMSLVDLAQGIIQKIQAMQNQRAIKKIKIAVTLFAAVLICSPLAWRAAQAAAQEQLPSRIEVVGVSVPFADRMGVDDGAAFVVHFIGGTHGSLEPCG